MGRWGVRGSEGRECDVRGGKGRQGESVLSEGDGEVSSTRAFLPLKWGGSRRPFPLA